ncbi:TetR family transcriptional regulator [Paraburkholderia sp. A1RI-2L]|uniref:TetR/AcrR family transcriptional regulator n=1 Tax=Paraburkholderia sp. A1RI-2L TaxID=3028367 RepID=UPI003B79B91B
MQTDDKDVQADAPDRIDYSQEAPTRILTAAARLIRRNGVRAVSFEGIAKAAGVTRGAIYYNFKGRDDLFLSLLEHLMDRRMAGLRKVLQASEPAARVNKVAALLAEDILEWRSWTTLFAETWLDALGSEGIMERLAKLRAGFYHQIAGVLKEAFPHSQPEAQEEFAVILLGVVAGLAIEGSISGLSLGAPQLERFLVDAMMARFGA